MMPCFPIYLSILVTRLSIIVYIAMVVDTVIELLFYIIITPCEPREYP